MSKKRSFTQEFKDDAVRYRKEHPELSLQKVSSNLGISMSALRRWVSNTDHDTGTVQARGSGNYASEEAKEIARLKRELRDKEDALELLKKPSVFWETNRGNLCCYCRLYKRNRTPVSETPGLC